MNQPPATFAPWRGVFETLRVIDGKPLFFAEHLAEITRAMEALRLATNFDFAVEALQLPMKSGRWRWIVTQSETSTRFDEEAVPPGEPIGLSVSPVRVGSQNWDALYKTVSYLSHAQALEMATTPDVVLLNERGCVASASRSNIFWRRGDRLFTPAHEAGCRCGVVRGFVFQQMNTERGHFLLAEMEEADEIFLTNSMRGIISINRFGMRVFESFPCADALREAYGHEVAQRLQNRLPIQLW